MTLYQGRALRAEPAAPPRRPAPGRGRIGRILQALAALAVVAALAHLPWGAWRARLAVVGSIRVTGLHYLDADRIAKAAGIARGQDLFAVDLARARQLLLLEPRVAAAEVRRAWPRGIAIRIVEREPVLLVRHGAPWELDSAGVLLAPLAGGAVADAPLLSGVGFEGVPAGTRLATPEVRRGLAWAASLADREIQLAAQVSELDVSDPRETGLILMDGTRVHASAWPPGVRTLSALRVVLADLHEHGTAAREVDLRFRDQVIVRPLDPVPALAASGPAPG